MTELWLEFEEGKTEAARIVEGIDALECMDQAVVYERRNRLQKDLAGFMRLETKIEVPQLRKWADHLLRERNDMWAGKTLEVEVLFLIGGPGSGKGTICDRLTQEFDCLCLSVGNLLREEAKSETSPFADFINDSLKNSVIVPADLTLKLIHRKMTSLQSESTLLVLDGFPRSLDQISAFEEKFSKPSSTILLECSEEAMIERLQKRSETSSRIDDNVGSFRRRLKTFSTENALVEEHLKSSGPFWKIDASGTAEEVYASVQGIIQQSIYKAVKAQE
ncbi:P-loop containing nucleoside triphosphate hydrolase protein [Myriangium duriaei CBS 260.36]|uniref:P-loop containing nucleoside triphosphate hydrolase protein n=1 Tax=Myriangium duriaei CBS 260.36 TaxID=1168546 RepID=A0A9P4MM84_9PEZI|nr:P-loop containing nucleoside triphosphate hydrolase protein [Myriangium duriaei CBS 260.36]